MNFNDAVDCFAERFHVHLEHIEGAMSIKVQIKWPCEILYKLPLNSIIFIYFTLLKSKKLFLTIALNNNVLSLKLTYAY
jgi:hypothetical protein